jgi:hypothetical protein
MTQENPITKSIEYLIECGWKKEQAINLIKAITDSNPDRLWEAAPQWIEHCGESMKYVHAMLGNVAMGLINVRMGENGEWLFALNETGLNVGKQLKERVTNG